MLENLIIFFIGLGIFHGDLDFFDLHEKSLDLSNYEIFPHKILKSRTFKKIQFNSTDFLFFFSILDTYMFKSGSASNYLDIF